LNDKIERKNKIYIKGIRTKKEIQRIRTEIDKQQTKRTIVHFSCQKREMKEKVQTIDHRQQSNHYPSIHAIPCEKGNDCASRETVDDQI